MKIYYNADDLENAEKNANLLIKNEYDEKDGKEMLESIQTLRKLQDIHKTNSAHFEVKNETKHVLNWRN